ncbi:hypothetical protein L2E82_16870 [Cichorium intybus]|uniref:Uncharacterized protein n=1 Tax=Cichorium intybus TaxID=13427 RepID=A0ACB9F823_CICIN|nr:hypothetical protein L2E82_16870 [Cichorium intybus]
MIGDVGFFFFSFGFIFLCTFHLPKQVIIFIAIFVDLLSFIWLIDEALLIWVMDFKNLRKWSMRFEEEEVRAVALGTFWVAAVTSSNFLRIFTDGGLQRHVISLDGPVVTASGFGDELAVMLEFKVFNVSSGNQPIKGKLPLTPGSTLSGLVLVNKGVLRVFNNQYGGSWFPLFSASKLKKKDESYWVVGLNKSNIFCVLCKSPDKFPQAIPKLVLTLLDLSISLESSDLGSEALEIEFTISNMHLSQAMIIRIETEAVGEDTTSLEDEAFNIEASLDRCILRLIASCCNDFNAMPVVDLEMPTLCLVGAPNVGKSSLVRLLSTGKPEVTDTPGILRRRDGQE